MSLHHFLCIWDYAYSSLNVPSCLESETKSWQWWVLKQGKGQWQANGNVWSHSSISQRHNVHLDQQTWALLTMSHQLSRLPLFVWRLQWELNILGKRLSCHCRENITQWAHSIWGTVPICLLTQWGSFWAGARGAQQWDALQRKGTLGTCLGGSCSALYLCICCRAHVPFTSVVYKLPSSGHSVCIYTHACMHNVKCIHRIYKHTAYINTHHIYTHYTVCINYEVYTLYTHYSIDTVYIQIYQIIHVDIYTVCPCIHYE